MNPAEYSIMASVEAEHWWYRSLRNLIGRSLDRFVHGRPDALSVLDAGCGTGENLRFLSARYSPRYLGGFDASPLAVQYARRKLPGADVYLSDLRDPELHHEYYDIVMSCDVLYIPGVQASLGGLQKIVERMRPGGLFVINLPAYDWLRSEHDLAIHTSERYVLSQVGDLLAQLSLTPLVLTYRLCGLLPLVVASRLPSMLFPRAGAADARSALHRGSRIGNGLFGTVMNIENRMIDAGWSMPWGSSVFAVGRRER